MGLNFFKIIQKIESAFMFILLHGGLETIILFVFGEELYNKYKINNNKNNIGMSRKKDKVKGIVFGKKTGKLYYSPTDAEGHVVCFAGSGLGKTSSILIPTLQHWDGTCYVVDISGDICQNVAVPNKIIFNPDDMNGVLYNIFFPVDMFENDADKNEALEQLAFQLMPLETNMTDTSVFFLTEGRKILTAAMITYYHQGMDFPQICKRIISSSWSTLFSEIDQNGNYEAKQYINSFEGTNEKNIAGCKQACDSALKLFATNSHVYNAIGREREGKEAFTPEQLENKNIFVVIQDSKLELYEPLVHIITAQCMEYFSNRDNNNQHTILMCLDEFASFGHLEITPALRKLRKKHVRIMVLTQSLADIDLIYGRDERMAMLNNFAYKIVLGCSDSDTQEYFSRLIGEKEVYRKAVSKNGKQVTNTRTEAKERIVPPAELARLGRHMILLAEGKYYKLTKNYYFELDLWDRVKKCINNLSRIQEEDFSEKNTLSLTDENK